MAAARVRGGRCVDDWSSPSSRSSPWSRPSWARSRRSPCAARWSTSSTRSCTMAHGRARGHPPAGAGAAWSSAAFRATPPSALGTAPPVRTGGTGGRPYQDTGTVNVLLPEGTDPASLDARDAGYRDDSGTGFTRLTDEQIDADARRPGRRRRSRTITLSGLGQYRAVSTIASDGSVAATAMPLAAVNSTITQLRRDRGRRRGVRARWSPRPSGMVLVRRELRPLDRVVTTANRVARLPLDRGEVVLADRVPAARHRPRDRGRSGGRRPQPAARARRAGPRRPARVRVAGAPVRRRRLARAAHAAGLDPRVRRAGPPLPRGAARRRPAGHVARRVRVAADDRAARGHAAARPPRRRPAAGDRARRPRPALDRRPHRRARGRPRPHLVARPRRGHLPGRRPRGRRRPPPAPGAGQPAVQRPSAHPGGHAR